MLAGMSSHSTLDWSCWHCNQMDFVLDMFHMHVPLLYVCFGAIFSCLFFSLAETADADWTWTKGNDLLKIESEHTSTLQLQFLILTTSISYTALECYNARPNIPCTIRVSFRCNFLACIFFLTSLAHLATFATLLNIIREQLLSE